MRINLLDRWRHLPTAELFGLAGSYRRHLPGTCAMGSAYRVGKGLVAVRLWRPTGSGPVHYLIDDDIAAGIADTKLPEGYRQRLRVAFEESLEKLAFGRIASVIIPSRRLEELYAARGLRVLRMDPAWDVPESLETERFAGSPLKVACLATRSHLADLEILREALEDSGRTWEFHHFMGSHAPIWLCGLPGVTEYPAMSWRTYRKFLSKVKFHVCVYPMLDTPFNLARSCNKVMEHAMVGAASLFSSRVPFAGLLNGGGGLLVDDGDWPAVLRDLAARRGACSDLAAAGHQLASETSRRARHRQHEVWSRIAEGG